MGKKKKSFYKRWWFILIIFIVVVSVAGSIKEKIRDAADKKVTYSWPDSTLASMLSKPDSKYGKVSMESDSYFSIDIYKITKEKYEEYVQDCENKGFTVDYMRQETYYSADNTEGYSLYLDYDEKEKTLSISLNAPVESSIVEEQGEVKLENSKEGTEFYEPEEYTQTTDMESENGNEEMVEGVRTEFKEVLDSYEAFMDEYCEFMKKYANADSDDVVSMTKDYLRLMDEEVEWIEKIDNMENENMNAAEAEYYTEVTIRVSQKLLNVTQ